MQILHLSDLHFGSDDDARTWCAALAEDLIDDLQCRTLDAVILSGDISNTASASEFNAALLFIETLAREFDVKRDAFVIVPGNHDVDWRASRSAYVPMRRSDYPTVPDDLHVYNPAGGDYIEVASAEAYAKRFAAFAAFFEKATGRTYSLEYGQQFGFHAFLPPLLVLGLNSAWQTDHLHPWRSGIHNHVINDALFQLRETPEWQSCLKMAVWHHPLSGTDSGVIQDRGFTERLAKAGFRIGLHGHVHETRADAFRYEAGPSGRGLEIVAAGTFGAATRELPFATPWQYNLIRLSRQEVVIETRARKGASGAWEPHALWRQGRGLDPIPRYRIFLPKGPHRRPPERRQMRSRAELEAYFEENAYNTDGYRIAVEAHIFRSDGLILLEQRGEECRDEIGMLEGVGGELGGGETDLHDALRRMIAKELGDSVDVAIDHLLEIRPVRFHEPRRGPQDWFIVSYLCRLQRGEPTIQNTGKVVELRYVSLPELEAMPEECLSRSTSRARTLYRALFGNKPYYEVMGIA